MTRYSRAKGSKASNERHPEEPTPWHVMKQELEISNAVKKEDVEQKTKSAKELLNEKDDLHYELTTGNVKTDWAEFEKPIKRSLDKVDSKQSNETPKKKKKKRESEAHPVEEKENDRKSQLENEGTERVTKNAVKRESTEPVYVMECGENENAEVVEAGAPEKKKKKKNRKNEISSPSEISNATNSGSQDVNNVKTENTNEPTGKVEGPTNKLSKRQKRNRKHRAKNERNGGENITADRSLPDTFKIDGNNWSNDIKFGDTKRNNEKSKSTDSKQNPNENQNRQCTPHVNEMRRPNNAFNNHKNQKKPKPPKIRDDKEHKRRKPAPDVNKVTINGMEVEIVMYDGFPVKKEDAERLKDLRQQMVMKGVPKSELEAAMKLERRKAEKALTRIKKKVCFHCRKAGHNLSDCPELGKEEAATGICFKCGSTEHTHFECKVNKKAEFRFASCFICREQGHIAKQCPDNPRGLYPDGGACNLCGDVTHLKKDCPDLAAVKEEKAITLNTISDSQLESLDEDSVIKSEDNDKKPKSKIVKF